MLKLINLQSLEEFSEVTPIGNYLSIFGLNQWFKEPINLISI